METNRRNLLTLLSSIPALGVLGLVGGTKAEAKDSAWPNKDVFVNRLVRERKANTEKYKNGCTDVTELPSPYPSTAWEKIERNIMSQEIATTETWYADGCRELVPRTKEANDVLALNEKIVAEHPSLFPTERIMTSPTCNINGQEIAAASRFMKAEYTFEFAQSLKSICGLDAETELRGILADETALELMRIDEKLMDKGYGICPYIPAQIARAVDPDTFQPKIRLLTMYGVMKL